MNKNDIANDIDIYENINADQSKMQLPLNFIKEGEIENDDLKVYIKQNVYKEIEKLASSDTTRELGSILIGDFTEETGKKHVVVSDYIEAKYTDASASSLTFTHESWEFIHGEHSSLYPNKKIIGWQHTHPNYGIFLSNYDMFIQENFFNLPFQIAYVIDPIQNMRGFFQWKNGRVEKLNGFYIYDDIGKPIKIERIKIKSKESEQAPGFAKIASNILLSVLLMSTIALTVFALSINNKYNLYTHTQEEVHKTLTSTNEQQQRVIEAQKEELKTAIADIEELKAMLKDKESLEPANMVYFKEYIVEMGDNLTSICEKNGLEYKANAEIIKAINGLDNPDYIEIGQVILLPLKTTLISPR